MQWIVYDSFNQAHDVTADDVLPEGASISFWKNVPESKTSSLVAYFYKPISVREVTEMVSSIREE